MRMCVFGQEVQRDSVFFHNKWSVNNESDFTEKGECELGVF